MLLKLLIIIVIFYYGWKVIKDFFNSSLNQDEIKGTPRKKKPLDLSKLDVEDADFEEIDE